MSPDLVVALVVAGVAAVWLASAAAATAIVGGALWLAQLVRDLATPAALRARYVAPARPRRRHTREEVPR